MTEKKGDWGSKSIHMIKPYQLLGWSLHPLSSSTSCHSCPSAYASGIHSLNHVQREPYLHLPVVSLMVLISATLYVWTRSPWSTRPHPRETAVVMVTQPITVAQGGAAGKVWARRDPPPQMAVSEYRQGQIGPLLLLATDLDPDLHATSWGFGGTCSFWDYILVLFYSDRVFPAALIL